MGRVLGSAGDVDQRPGRAHPPYDLGIRDWQLQTAVALRVAVAVRPVPVGGCAGGGERAGWGRAPSLLCPIVLRRVPGCLRAVRILPTFFVNCRNYRCDLGPLKRLVIRPDT